MLYHLSISYIFEKICFLIFVFTFPFHSWCIGWAWRTSDEDGDSVKSPVFKAKDAPVAMAVET